MSNVLNASGTLQEVETQAVVLARNTAFVHMHVVFVALHEFVVVRAVSIHNS